ncbi:MAG: ATP-binding protein, partial [bacterium]|nr:ATP-binding protein [bacterium]
MAIKHKNGRIEVEELHAKSRHYLERMGLFKILGVKTGISVIEHEPSGRFVPISRITDSAELDKFITDIVPLLHLEPEQAEPIRYVISELVRNVLEHAQTPDGAIVCAQFYKKSNAIKIGVADTGIGVKSSINSSYEASDDLAAIKLALTPGITGTTNKVGGTESNAGAGLFFIKSIAKTNRDFFVIYSGNAMY